MQLNPSAAALTEHPRRSPWLAMYRHGMMDNAPSLSFKKQKG